MTEMTDEGQKSACNHWVEKLKQLGLLPVYTQTTKGWEARVNIAGIVYSDDGYTQNAAAFKLLNGPAGVAFQASLLVVPRDIFGVLMNQGD